MQDFFGSHSDYLRRTARLAVRLGLNTQDLTGVLDLSRASLFSYRAGSRPITRKAWLKLEEAESKAGILPEPEPRAEATSVKEDATPYQCEPRPALRKAGEPSLQDRLARMEENSAQMRESMEAMRRALDELTDLFTTRRKP